MRYDVLMTPEFSAWLDGISVRAQDAVLSKIKLLEEFGPALGRPHADTLEGSKYSNMKELRADAGSPYRMFYAFNPRRQAIMLTGGDKAHLPRFYQRELKKAEELYAKHLESLKR